MCISIANALDVTCSLSNDEAPFSLSVASFQRREREMQQKLEHQEESALNMQDTYTSMQQEVEIKTKKLKKVCVRQRISYYTVQYAAVEVWEWISNFIPHFTGHSITYLC